MCRLNSLGESRHAEWWSPRMTGRLSCDLKYLQDVRTTGTWVIHITHIRQRQFWLTFLYSSDSMLSFRIHEILCDPVFVLVHYTGWTLQRDTFLWSNFWVTSKITKYRIVSILSEPMSCHIGHQWSAFPDLSIYWTIRPYLVRFIFHFAISITFTAENGLVSASF